MWTRLQPAQSTPVIIRIDAGFSEKVNASGDSAHVGPKLEPKDSLWRRFLEFASELDPNGNGVRSLSDVDDALSGRAATFFAILSANSSAVCCSFSKRRSIASIPTTGFTGARGFSVEEEEPPPNFIMGSPGIRDPFSGGRGSTWLVERDLRRETEAPRRSDLWVEVCSSRCSEADELSVWPFSAGGGSTGRIHDGVSSFGGGGSFGSAHAGGP